MSSPEKLKLIGSTLGDPNSPTTYSGVPFHLFKELDKLGCLAGTVNSYERKFTDVFLGGLDFKRTLLARSPRKNALWRYSFPGVKTLSKRLQKKLEAFSDYNAVLQIGVGAIPKSDIPLIAHNEISIKTAINSEVFARSYGFRGLSRRAIDEALKVERAFFERCSLIWTNSTWTSQGIIDHGIDPDKIFVYPPAPGIADPGIIDRDWSKLNILFIGKDWSGKGGKILVDAFRLIRRDNRKSQLSIIGCNPRINLEGVKVLGFLRKNVPADLSLLEKVLQESTIFCMPSYWESTGMVYMEAALWGLPVIMMKGQGREEIFPEDVFTHLERDDPRRLADMVLELSKSPERMKVVGDAGREFVRTRYNWRKVATLLCAKMKNAI